MLDFANILKTFIGSNFLGMPYAFHQAGVYVQSPLRSLRGWLGMNISR